MRVFNYRTLSDLSLYDQLLNNYNNIQMLSYSNEKYTVEILLED